VLREDKIKDLARRIALMISQEKGTESYLLPDEEFVILVHGKVDVLALAEWVYERLG
jgi:hypothetical protein